MPGLPNPGMTFTPFDPLPASDLNDMVENIESLADGTGFDAGALTTDSIADGAVTANKLGLSPAASTVDTSQTTASTSYVDLATVQSVTVTVGANGLLLVGINFEGSNSGADSIAIASFALSGANTLAAADANKAQSRLSTATATQRVGVTKLITGLTPGSTTVTMKFRTTSGTGSFLNRHLFAIPL